MAAAYTLCRGPIAGAVGIGSGRVLVSVQGDGVSCYDCNTRKPVLSWALGSTDQEFSGPAVYDYASNLCFAPLRPRGAGPGGKSGSVLAWSADESAGTITQLAHPLHLPALHRLFPLSRTPQGEAEEAAAAEAEERAAAEVDGSGQRRAGAVAVLAAGGAALCSGAEVVAEAEDARGQHTLAAAYTAGRLVQVVSEPRSGAVSVAVYRTLGGGQLESEGLLRLQAPTAGCRAVAATSTAERTAVLWSDGTVAVYGVPGDARPLLPLPAGSNRDAVVQRRLAGFRLPAGKQQKSSGGSKKRGTAAEPEAAEGSVSMAAIGDKQVAVVGWANGSDGATVLRLVVLETSAGCVQLAQDFTAADVGLAVLDHCKPVQVDSLGSSQLAVSVGSAVLVVTCSDLRPPTLANLLGALAIDKALIAQRSSGGSSSGGGRSGSALLAPTPEAALLGGSVAVNPAALAAARVLHPDELAVLAAPFGGAPRPIEHSVVLEEPTEPGQWLVPAKEVTWRVADVASDASLAAEEQRLWQEVQQPAAAALGSDATLQQALEPLLEQRRSSGLALSPPLVSALLMLAAEHGHWGAAAVIAAAQAPHMLGDVPGLSAAAADAGRMDLLEQLLLQSSDVPAAELAALLRVLLSPPSSDAAAAGQQQRHAAAQAAAEAAQRAAQQAAVAGPQAQQQQQQQQHPPATAGKASRRRRRKKGAVDGGAGDSDSDVEDLTTLTSAVAEPGADDGDGDGAAQGAATPAAAAQQPAAQQQAAQLPVERPGAREQAVAACCRAAVEGLEPADSCLHPALVVPHRPAVLLEALRSLSAQQAVALLRYLTALLRNHGSLVGSAAAGWRLPLALPAGIALPPLQHVVAWANALLDASLIKLSLQPEAKPVLAELSALVDAQVTEARPLLRLGGIVAHLVNQQAVPRAAVSAADYSVQWLDLRVLPPEQRAVP